MSDDYYIFGKEFHQKWFTARPLSNEDRRAYESRKRLEIARKIIEHYDEISELVDDIDKAGGSEVAGALKRALGKLNKFRNATELGADAAEAAIEVETLLIGWYKTSYDRCKAESSGDDDQYFVCVARIDRKWQGRNIDWILNSDRDNSWVRKVFLKWKKRALEWITPI